MKHLFLSFLLNLPLFLAPALVLAADPKPKAADSDQPTGGVEAQQQPAAGQAPAVPGADAEAGNADSDKPDADQPKRPKTGSRPTSMSIIPVPGGQKTLAIHFRWSLYPNGSVEVRLVPGPDPKGATVAPIYFSEHLHGTVRKALYTCLDHPGEGGRTHSFTKNKIVYDMIGRRNSLGNQGVHVQVHAEDSKGPEANPAAAYLQLDTWAVDPETLSLDLARDEFARSGTLFVWFFRGDQVVWEEQIRWPGYGAK
jgi:hypothetical protein